MSASENLVDEVAAEEAPAVLDLHHFSALQATLAPRGEGFLRGFVERFLVDAERGVGELTSGSEPGDLGAIRERARQLRSGAATLGGLRFAACLEELERSARRGARAERSSLEALASELRALRLALREAGVLDLAGARGDRL